MLNPTCRRPSQQVVDVQLRPKLYCLLFQLASVALIVIGIISIKRDVFEDFEDNSLEETFESIAIGIIVVGCVLFLFTFSGCVGAIMEINNVLIIVIIPMNYTGSQNHLGIRREFCARA